MSFRRPGFYHGGGRSEDTKTLETTHNLFAVLGQVTAVRYEIRHGFQRRWSRGVISRLAENPRRQKYFECPRTVCSPLDTRIAHAAHEHQIHYTWVVGWYLHLFPSLRIHELHHHYLFLLRDEISQQQLNLTIQTFPACPTRFLARLGLLRLYCELEVGLFSSHYQCGSCSVDDCLLHNYCIEQFCFLCRLGSS